VNGADHRVHRAHAGARGGNIAAIHRRHVGTGAESVAGAGQHDSAHRLVGHEAAEGLQQRLPHLQREGVLPAWVADRHQRHGSVPLDIDRGHFPILSQDARMIAVPLYGLNSTS